MVRGAVAKKRMPVQFIVEMSSRSLRLPPVRPLRMEARRWDVSF